MLFYGLCIIGGLANLFIDYSLFYGGRVLVAIVNLLIGAFLLYVARRLWRRSASTSSDPELLHYLKGTGYLLILCLLYMSFLFAVADVGARQVH